MTIAETRRAARGMCQILTLAAALVFVAPALAANYPLELVSPRAVGTAPAAGNAAITSTHRIFRAYPGLEYNIRAVVVGGAYPYRFSLSNAPSGMSINEHTGLVVWPNPQANASPAITVTDSEGTRASSNWSITVTTSGFRFIDAVNGRSNPTGTGESGNPWRTISDMMNSSAADSGDIVYFRSGVYRALDLPRVSTGSTWERVEFQGISKPTIWLAYPGETPVIDFGFSPGNEPGVIFRFSGGNTYVDGFETRNSRIIGFQVTSGSAGSYRVFRRLRMHDHNMISADLDGTNASYIMMTSSYSDSSVGGNPGTWSQYLAVQDSEFYRAPRDMALKTYSQWKMLVEDNVFHDMQYGAEIKADMPQFTYRHNRHYAIHGRAIGGNMHSAPTHGEILYNLVNTPPAECALDVNQDGQAKRIDIYRNTFIGRVRVRNTSEGDGPFNFYNNVIVNNDEGTPSGSHIYHLNVSAPSRISIANNLAGNPSANIVDSTGALTPAYQQYLGTRGHQIGAGHSPPSPPANLIVE